MKIIKFREKDNYVSQQCSMGGDRGGKRDPRVKEPPTGNNSSAGERRVWDQEGVRMSLVESRTQTRSITWTLTKPENQSRVSSRDVLKEYSTQKRRRCLFYDGPRSGRPWVLIGWRGPTALTGENWRNAYSIAVCMQCAYLRDSDNGCSGLD